MKMSVFLLAILLLCSCMPAHSIPLSGSWFAQFVNCSLCSALTSGDEFVEEIQIPSTGAVVQSSPLKEDALYKVVITGLFRYDEGEPGEFADAQYREDDNDQFVRYNNVQFNNERPDADISDLPNHTYSFWYTGTGDVIAFRIYDSDPSAYNDNEGALTAKIIRVVTAHEPFPADGATRVVLPELRWQPRPGATAHCLYFGTSSALGNRQLCGCLDPKQASFFCRLV